ncbi:MAG: hypothetical protein ACKVZH_01745 [Blastocatellia bacterium]
MEIPDSQVRDVAEQYDDARRLLQQQPPGSGVLLPLLNTAAVAVELFLKSLSTELIHSPIENDGLSIVRSKPELQDHKLEALLDKIPDDVRDDLENSFGKKSDVSLREMLRRYEGLFQVSRYPFEPPKEKNPLKHISEYSLMELMALSEFLRSYVAKIEACDRIDWS